MGESSHIENRIQDVNAVMHDDAAARRLLFLLSEELKQPLVSIAQIAELEDGGAMIHAYAQKALRTIDSVLLYHGLSSGQISMKLEPVHVGGTAQAVAEVMGPLMRAQACTAELDIQSSLQTADIDRKLLLSALQSLWQAVLGSLDSPSRIVCRVQKISKGVRLSVLSPAAQLDNLRLREHSKFSSQPITALAGSSADLLTASSMFELAGARVTKTASKDMKGLGVTLRLSKQLQLV